MPVDLSHLLQEAHLLLQLFYTARLPPRVPGCYFLYNLAFLWPWNFFPKTAADTVSPGFLSSPYLYENLPPSKGWLKVTIFNNQGN